MKLSIAFTALLVAPVAAFVPINRVASTVLRMGYLDELNPNEPQGKRNDWLYEQEPEDTDDSREATALDKGKVDRGGVGDWSQFVDFDEFDGGDGQMGVAGDGKKELEKFDMSEMGKSKAMSAKNAWGKSTGYADTLIDEGIEAQRAQQLENWKNQQEVLNARKQQRFMTDDFDQVDSGETSQWDLSKFGVERNQEFDLNDAFGPVVAGDIEGVIEMKANLNQNAVHEFNLKNQFMGFADFRAAFTPDTPPFWTIDPAEGALDKQGTDFSLRFRPQAPGVVEGYLVIETEDFKKTWKLVGGTA